MNYPATRVVHFKSAEYEAAPLRLYIGRHPDPVTGRWGNPYGPASRKRVMGSLVDLWLPDEDVLPAYRDYILAIPERCAELRELNGYALGCWCREMPIHKTQADVMYCHGHVLVEIRREWGLEPSGEIPRNFPKGSAVLGGGGFKPPVDQDQMGLFG